MPISRQDPFNHKFGDVHENMFAYMLEELDDDVDCLIDRLNEVNLNLDTEIGKINSMIAETGPRHSTKFSKIALQLKDNLQRRISETMTGRSSASTTVINDDEVASSSPELMDGMMEFAINRSSNRVNNRSSRSMHLQASDIGQKPQAAAKVNSKMSEQFAEELRRTISETSDVRQLD